MRGRIPSSLLEMQKRRKGGEGELRGHFLSPTGHHYLVQAYPDMWQCTGGKGAPPYEHTPRGLVDEECSVFFAFTLLATPPGDDTAAEHIGETSRDFEVKGRW